MIPIIWDVGQASTDCISPAKSSLASFTLSLSLTQPRRFGLVLETLWSVMLHLELVSRGKARASGGVLPEVVEVSELLFFFGVTSSERSVC